MAFDPLVMYSTNLHGWRRAGLLFISLLINASLATQHCSDIYSFTGDEGFEAPTKVTNVSYVPANTTTGIPAYCSVSAEINSNGLTTYVAYLPAEKEDWSGHFLSHGCGGSCGWADLDVVRGYGTYLGIGRDRLRDGYAISMNDMGHQNLGGSQASNWTAFRNNRQVEYNWAYLSTHLSVVSTKALIHFYYGSEAKRSIFFGGSQGGRQALISAARYPHDFHGVIAGFAVSNETGGSIHFPWAAQASMYPNRTQILNTEDVSSLHLGALAACDGNDGLIDGIIDPSYSCDFDPIDILCSRKTLKSSGGCLANMDKVTAARKLYQFPSNNYTDKLINARYLPGAELSWSVFTTESGVNSAEGFTINAALQTDLPLNWTLAQYDWNTYPYLMKYMEDIYSADYTSLKTFRDKGGKILQYQGYADANVAPGYNLDLIQSTINEIGYDKAQDFHRLFMMPGMAHSDVSYNLNGTIGWRCDYFKLLEAWLDTGIPPNIIEVEHWNYTTGAHIDYRPYFYYPYTPKYKSGNPDNSTSWVGAIPPKSQRSSDYTWTGEEGMLL